jgi:hypothetical protein
MAGHVAWMGEMSSSCRILFWNLEVPGVYGKIVLKWIFKK